MLNNDAAKLRVASFFSGIGGFDLAFERAGCEVVFQCGRDAFCQRVLKKHWPHVPLAPDIVQLTHSDIPGVTLVEWTEKDYAIRSSIVHLLSYAAGER